MGRSKPGDGMGRGLEAGSMVNVSTFNGIPGQNDSIGITIPFTTRQHRQAGLEHDIKFRTTEDNKHR